MAKVSGLNQEALNKAISALSINSVYLRKSSIEMHDDFEPSLRPQALDVQTKANAIRHRIISGDPIEGSTEEPRKWIAIDVEVGARFLLRDPADLVRQHGSTEEIAERIVGCQVEAIFSTVYACDPSNVPPPEAINEFARVNALYHVWPFWREFLHSTCGRLSIAAVTLPMMVVRSSKEAASPPTKAGKAK
jgi:hypothetical protein